MHIRHAHALPAGASPWSSQAALRGLPDSERQRDVLDVAFLIARARNPQATTKELVRSLWANPSQCVARTPWGQRPATPTTSALVYSFASDCVLSGEALLRGLGWPRGFAPQEMFTEHQIRGMAGEA